jgi:hypothetical protein
MVFAYRHPARAFPSDLEGAEAADGDDSLSPAAVYLQHDPERIGTIFHRAVNDENDRGRAA